MSAFFGQVLSLLTGPPGNLIYQLVLAFSIAGALQGAVTHWSGSESEQARRTVLGLGILLAIQILFFGVAGLSWRGFISPTWALPPVDRAVTVISLVWIAWLWAFPRPSSQADAAAALLSMLAVAGAALSLLAGGSSGTAEGYNRTVDDILWQIVSIGVIGLGAALLLIRRTEGYVNGLAFLGLVFIGHAIHLVLREQGDYSGILRIAYIAAFPILLTLPQRFTSAEGSPQPVSAAAQESGAAPKRYGADPKTLHALLGLAGDSDTSRLNQSIPRAVSHTMLADLAFLILPNENKNDMSIAGGYDLIREEYLEGAAIDKSVVPRIASAMQRGKPLRLQASSGAADIKALGDLLGLGNPGSLLSVPIVTPQNDLIGGLVLLSPYSTREWSTEDQAILLSFAGELVPILQRAGRVSELEGQSRDFEQALSRAEVRVEELERQQSQLSGELGQRTQEAEGRAAAAVAELDSLRAAHSRSEAQITELQRRLEAAESAAQQPTDQMPQELRAALQDVARLQNQLAETSQKLMELEKGAVTGRRKSEQAEVIASISQELRQPMSSIIGYTDLLLGESVGILGALQRKFIERIKASTERIGSLIDDMIQLNTLEVGLSDLKPEAMDLNLIIDNALAYTSSQVREKKISIHLDLPKKVPPVNADREALQQILIHLLQNAGSATPVEGSVGIKVQTTSDEGRPVVMIQVTDSGGGIPEEDLARVFTRLYRADNVLIQGIGDTGVGLSIAKTLTEAQHGRIWVESQAGAGATFNVLLPVVGEAVDWRPGKEIL